MSPSRGPASNPPGGTQSPSSTDEALVDAHSSTALQSAKRNLKYLYNPQAYDSARPTRLRTRALLRTIRFATIFIFWRVVRYAKYAAIASIVATVGAGVAGSFLSGAGFILAPTGIAGTIFAATIWGFGKFAVRRLEKRWKKGKERGLGYDDTEELIERRRPAPMKQEIGSEAMPW